MLFEELGFREASLELEAAVAGAVRAGETTPDLGGTLGTRSATDAFIARLASG